MLQQQQIINRNLVNRLQDFYHFYLKKKSKNVLNSCKTILFTKNKHKGISF